MVAKWVHWFVVGWVLSLSAAVGIAGEAKRITGLVHDTHEQPVAEALVVLVQRHGLGDDRWVVTTETDTEGKYTLELPSEWLVPGAYYFDGTIWAYADGHAVSTTRGMRQWRADSKDPETIVLPDKQPLSFTVVDSQGAPVVGAKIEPHHWHTGNIVPDEIAQRVAATTNAAGQATMQGIARESLRNVNVLADSHQRFRLVDRSAHEFTIALANTGTLKGRLVCDDPAIVANRRIIAEASEQLFGPPVGFAESTTDEQGRFEIKHLAEGEYRTYIDTPEQAAFCPRIEPIVVAADQVVEVDIEYDKTTLVRGQVVARGSDKPVVGAFVSVRHGTISNRESVLTDEQGRFEVHVLPGTVAQTLVVMPDEFKEWIRVRAPLRNVEVPQSEEPFDLPPLEIAKSKTLELQVVDKKGAPKAEIYVRVMAEGAYLAAGQTDQQGKATLHVNEDAQPDEFRLSILGQSEQSGKVTSESPLVLEYRDPNDLVNVKVTSKPTPPELLEPEVPQHQEEIGTLIVAKEVLIFNDRMTSWADLSEELERRAGTKGGDLSMVQYNITRAAYEDPVRRQEAQNWAQMLTDTTGVNVQMYRILFNAPADRYDVMKLTDQWPPGAEHPVNGRVVDADGNPVADAQVVLLVPPATGSRQRTNNVTLRDGQVASTDAYVVKYSDSDGRFEFEFPTPRTNVIVCAKQGFAMVAASSTNADITLAPWSRLTVHLPQDRKLGNQTIMLYVDVANSPGTSTFIRMSQGSSESIAQDFTFAAVPSGHKVRVSRLLWKESEEGYMTGNSYGESYRLETKPGMTHHLEYAKASIEDGEPVD
ncbi:carboxypeptidase-like regulatory domain-containing protein [Aeoliella mucimassa]|uniref:Bacterial Ig-like domain (Group 1) n=1 Tax=Aeoliella mucimassa TaxID=2527972 RepID=A0A518AGK7_9BACT|nr:carboxypeptidase-like regulatory domain-containing protein [Aeoliella mucimassa]QDU53865.1 Bacterial Ig-like domain (group 1) [Aeoliella mucimassa]